MKNIKSGILDSAFFMNSLAPLLICPTLAAILPSFLAPIFPNFDVDGQWVKSHTISAHDFSAIGYIFGTKLFENLNIPVGIIESSWGGTKIESWMPKAALLNYENIKIPIALSKEQNKQKKPSFLYARFS